MFFSSLFWDYTPWGAQEIMQCQGLNPDLKHANHMLSPWNFSPYTGEYVLGLVWSEEVLSKYGLLDIDFKQNYIVNMILLMIHSVQAKVIFSH